MNSEWSLGNPSERIFSFIHFNTAIKNGTQEVVRKVVFFKLYRMCSEAFSGFAFLPLPPSVAELISGK